MASDQDKGKLKEELNQLLMLDPPPQSTSYKELGEYHKKQAEKLKKALTLLEQMGEKDTDFYKKVMEDALYQEAFAKYYSTIAFVEFYVEDHLKDKNAHPIYFAGIWGDAITYYKQLYEDLKPEQFTDLKYKYVVNQLKVKVGERIVDSVNRLVSVYYAMYADKLLGVANELEDHIVIPGEGAFYDQLAKIYGFGASVLSNIRDIRKLALEMYERAYKFTGDEELSKKIKDVREHLNADDIRVNGMSAVQKFFALLASAPRKPQPNAPAEELAKYYDEMERIYTTALETIKPLTPTFPAVRELYNIYENELLNLREERKRVLRKK